MVGVAPTTWSAPKLAPDVSWVLASSKTSVSVTRRQSTADCDKVLDCQAPMPPYYRGKPRILQPLICALPDDALVSRPVAG